MTDECLNFRYSAIALFREPRAALTEMRVVLLSAVNREDALEEAESIMRSYASDFNFEYAGVVNVFEFGSDMLKDYGELFSVTWKSDPVFDAELEVKFQE